MDGFSRVMPFGLKNEGATYQRVSTILFHDMMHKDAEVYVDDMIMKSQVTFGKLLGHMVSEWGIEVDLDKIKAILDMPVSRTEKRDQGFSGQIAFEKIKECLLSPPILVPPTPGRPLILYLSISDMALGCMLAQLDDSRKKRVIYYLSKRMLEYEMRYVMTEHICLALVWATRRLKHYMTEYSACLISRLDPLRYLFDRSTLTGRLMRWLVLLTEFDIQYVSQKSIMGSIVVDHLASLQISEGRPVDDDFPNEVFIAMTSLSSWRMYFDGATNHSGFGIGVLLISPQRDHIPRQIQGDWRTRDVKLRSYHAYLELLTERFDDLRYTHLPRVQNQFANALATLDRVMREVHAGVFGPHMGGHMLARKIMRTGPFSVWGIDIIGKISLKSSNGHEFILVAIDYFTKWVEVASYGRLTFARVASFISRGRPQTNGAVEAANKNIKKILRKMVETSRDWLEKLPFALLAYCTSFHTSIGATPYSLVYGIEVVLLVKTEMGSLRVALKKQIFEIKKRVRLRSLQKGDLVLRILRGLVGNPRGNFRLGWSKPYVIRELTPEGVAWLTDLDGNQFSELTNVDQLNKYYI
ncbi:Retrovirus-related Pol polyprotein from transposon 297 [Vitis vinifera]|uniref:Retrovirus-related Pol polyprotein from transposon 297 n=1 Tax=Vitis vinifera TaxID=29760 RepID=A0A438CYX5_VITVI|nr:Retrovirus-related Pol polyprotein from transposon 297 [Vitis vinifera]